MGPQGYASSPHVSDNTQPHVIQTEPATQVTDVALGPGGVLRGQVVNSGGAALQDAKVAVFQSREAVATSQAGPNGEFEFRGLRGGVYQLGTENGTMTCRLWTSESAPPSARTSVALVSSDMVVRGQYYGRPGCGPVCHPRFGYGRYGSCGPPACAASCEPSCPPVTACDTGCPAPCGPCGPVFGWCRQNPLVAAGVIAAAIAIPIAVSNNDDVVVGPAS